MTTKLAPRVRIAIAIATLATLLSACNPAHIVTTRTDAENSVVNWTKQTCDPQYDMNQCKSVMP